MGFLKHVIGVYVRIFAILFFVIGVFQLRSLADVVLFLFFIPLLLYFLIHFLGMVHFQPAIWRRRSSSIFQFMLVLINSLLTTALVALMALNIKNAQDKWFVVLLVPVPFYFWLKLLGYVKRLLAPLKFKPQSTVHSQDSDEALATENIEQPMAMTELKRGHVPAKKTQKSAPHIDTSRRNFLKFIGAAGITFALSALLNPKKSFAAFFGSSPGPGTMALKDISGEKIDPAIKSPTDAYGITEIDDTSSPAYYGYVNKDGSWYIAREDTNSYRYAQGGSNFSGNWILRGTLTYGYFDSTF